MGDSVHIVCPNCDAINRIPSARLHENPRCGNCHRDLFQASPVDLTGANFQRYINRNDIPVLVDFWAPWCAPCKMMAPAYKQAAAQLEPEIRLAKLNTEAEPGLGAHYQIRSIPTLALFRQGREVARQPGALATGDIVRWVRANISR